MIFLTTKRLYSLICKIKENYKRTDRNRNLCEKESYSFELDDFKYIIRNPKYSRIFTAYVKKNKYHFKRIDYRLSRKSLKMISYLFKWDRNKRSAKKKLLY